jgi:hypothetical protein
VEIKCVHDILQQACCKLAVCKRAWNKLGPGLDKLELLGKLELELGKLELEQGKLEPQSGKLALQSCKLERGKLELEPEPDSLELLELSRPELAPDTTTWSKLEARQR